ncbi:MAG: tetratricopeptide repeat protein [Gracilibacteraceae bacterium]|jgi:tetratricopeptide (TPR) repeat protein|nr:tetratricopeptide repeat protein [Gracilibacteraceae bacterium]
MKYEEIMQKVTSGLTGKPDADMEYLRNQSEKYKMHELAQEILRGIGRLMYEVIPPDKREEMERLFKNNRLGVDTSIEEAEFQIHKKNFGRALEILESIIKKIEDDNGELIMFRDDSVSEYHCFRNILEEILYKEMNKPQRTVRAMPEDFDHLYFMYGNLLFELKRFDESSTALKKAIRINPINADAMLELAEISKVKGEWKEYLELTKQCLCIAYSGSNVGRCYRNMGFYYIEKQKYDVATVLYYISMLFDRQSNMAQSELLYIQQISGKPTPPPSGDEVQKIFEQYNIQSGANDLVLGIAAGLGRSAKEQEHYDAARFFFSILYDLTNDDVVKGWIDNLPT